MEWTHKLDGWSTEENVNVVALANTKFAKVTVFWQFVNYGANIST